MSRTYRCDAPDCEETMDGMPIEVTYHAVESPDDDEPEFTEVHFCSWVCLSSWATAAALDYPPMEDV